MISFFHWKLVWYPDIWLFSVVEFCGKGDGSTDDQCPKKEISALDLKQFHKGVWVLEFSEISILPAEPVVFIKTRNFIIIITIINSIIMIIIIMMMTIIIIIIIVNLGSNTNWSFSLKTKY